MNNYGIPKNIDFAIFKHHHHQMPPTSRLVHCRNGSLLCVLVAFVMLVGMSRQQAIGCIYSDSAMTQPLNNLREANSCLPCLPTCLKCEAPNDSSCSQGSCAPYHYYQTSQKTCVRCPTFCQSCEQSATTSRPQCLNCISGYYYNDNTGSCQPCDPGAKICTSSATLLCKSGYYYDSQSFVCKKCSTNCQTCTSKLQCSKCFQYPDKPTGKFLLQTYTDDGRLSISCVECSVAYCQDCSSSLTTCLKCIKGYRLYSNNLCKSQRQICQIDLKLSNCISCESNGTTNTCNLCESNGYFLYDGSCRYGASLMCQYALTRHLLVNQLDGHSGSEVYAAVNYGRCLTCNPLYSYSPSLTSNQYSNSPTFCLIKDPNSNRGSFTDYLMLMDTTVCQKYPQIVSGAFQSIFIAKTAKSFISTHKLSYFDPQSSKLVPSSYILSATTTTILKLTQTNFIHYLNTPTYDQQQQSILSQLQNFSNNSSILSFTITNIENKVLSTTTTINKLYCREFITDYQMRTSNQTNTTITLSSLSFYFFIRSSVEIRVIMTEQTSKQHLSLGIEFSNANTFVSSNFGNTSASSDIEISLSLSEMHLSFKTCLVEYCEQCYSPNWCTQCQSPYLIEDNLKCVQTCSEGYFTNSELRTCVYSCQDGFYADLILRKCVKCQQQQRCRKCLQNSYCVECLDGFYLRASDGKCVSLDLILGTNNITNSSLDYNYSSGCQSVGYYEDYQTKTCAKCLNPCRTCEHPKQSDLTSYRGTRCTSCLVGFLYNKSCYSQCSLQAIGVEGYYEAIIARQLDNIFNQSTLVVGSINFSSAECSLCDLTCKTCELTPTLCLSCKEGSYLSDNSCLLWGGLTLPHPCPSRYFPNKQTNICEPCLLPCDQCLGNANNCTTCSYGYLLKQSGGYNICVNSCPQKLYKTNPTTKQCELCSLTGCLYCKNVPQIASNTTTANPSSTAYTYLQQCLLCDRTLSYILLTDSKSCVKSSCPNGWPIGNTFNRVTSSGLITIQTGYYCALCPYPCKTCSKTNQHTNETLTVQSPYFFCLKCIDSYYLYFPSANTSLFEQSNYYGKVSSSHDACVLRCPVGYFGNLINGRCERCPDNCHECLMNSTTEQVVCLSCSNGYKLYIAEGDTEGGSCIEICPINSTVHTLQITRTVPSLNQSTTPGYSIINISSLQCIYCSSNCKQCIDYQPAACTQCYTGFLLDVTAKNCVEQCPLGTSKSIVPTSLTCVPCPDECSTCKPSTSNIDTQRQYICTSCQYPKYLYAANNSCLLKTECSSIYGFYPLASPQQLTILTSSNVEKKVISLVCESCPTPCTDCLSALECIECDIGNYLLIDGMCVSEDATNVSACGDGYYRNLNMRKCVPCSQYMPSDSTLRSCQTCVDSASNCQSCPQGSYLSAHTDGTGICLTKCPSGFYGHPQDRQCRQCRSPCLECSQLEICTKCVDTSSNQPMFLINGRCYETCPVGYYQQEQNNTQICVHCPDQCTQCQNSTFCTHCEGSYYLVDGSCLPADKCPTQTYPEPLSNTCEPCEPPCILCSSQYYCLSCIQLMVQREGGCYSQCPIGSYVSTVADQNISSLVCLNCSPNCLKCNSQSQCSYCSSGTYLLQQQTTTTTTGSNSTAVSVCVSECPSGYYLPTSTNKYCEKCSDQCLSCSLRANNCTHCQNGSYTSQSAYTHNLFLQRNRCVKTCSNYYYPAVDTHQIGTYDLKSIQSNTTLQQQLISQDSSQLVCMRCNISCFRCNNYNKCQQCFQSYLIIVNDSSSYCSLSCPQMTFKNSQSLICQDCPEGCQVCTNEQICQKCSNKQYVLYGGKCNLYPCPKMLYYLEIENRCVNYKKCVEELGYYYYEFVETNKYPYPMSHFIPNVSKCLSSGEMGDGCPLPLVLRDNRCVTSCNPNESIKQVPNKTNQYQCYSAKNSQQVARNNRFVSEVVRRQGKLFIYILFNDPLLAKNQQDLASFAGVSQMFEGNISLSYMTTASVTTSRRRLQPQGSGFNRVFVPASVSLASGHQYPNTLVYVLTPDSNQEDKDIKSKVQSSPLELTIISKQPFGKVISSQQTPVQNWYYTQQSVYIGHLSPSTSKGIVGLSCLLLIVVFVLTLAFLIKMPSKVYLLISIWDLMQFLDVFIFIQTNWSPAMDNFLMPFKIVNLRWWTFGDSNKLVYSPQKFYAHSSTGDMSLFGNIGCGLTLIAIALIFMLIVKIVNKLCKTNHQRQIQPNQPNPNPNNNQPQSKQFDLRHFMTKLSKKILVCTIYLNITNIILFAVINVAYTDSQIPANRQDSQYRNDGSLILSNSGILFSRICSYLLIIGIAGFILFALGLQVFAAQVKKRKGAKSDSSQDEDQQDKKVQQPQEESITSLVKEKLINRLFLDPGINPSKKNLIKSLPLYLLFRKLLIVSFVSLYYYSPAHMVCMALFITVFISALVFWYEPFVNKTRHRMVLASEGGFFVLMFLLFAYVCNPYMGHSERSLLQAILILSVCLLVGVFCFYPIMVMYRYLRYNEDIEVGVDNKSLMLKLDKQSQDNQSQNKDQQPSNTKSNKALENQQINSKKSRIITVTPQPKTTQQQQQPKKTNQMEKSYHKKGQKKKQNNKFELRSPSSLNNAFTQKMPINSQTDHEADKSSDSSEQAQAKDQGNSPETARLTKRHNVGIKEFKNYDIEEEDDDYYGGMTGMSGMDNSLKLQSQQLSRVVERQKSIRNNAISSLKEDQSKEEDQIVDSQLSDQLQKEAQQQIQTVSEHTEKIIRRKSNLKGTPSKFMQLSNRQSGYSESSEYNQ